MGVRVIMTMMVVPVIVTATAGIPVGMCSMIMAPVIMAPVIMGISAGFRLERPSDMGNLAALSTHHFSKHVIVLDVNRIGCNFGRGMTITDMPSHFQKPQRIVSLDFQQGFRRCLYQYQAAVIEFQSISVIENGCFFKIEQKCRAFFAIEHNTAFVPAIMIKRDLINHTLDFNRRLAKDRR